MTRYTLLAALVVVPLLLVMAGRLPWLAALAVPAGLFIRRASRVFMVMLAAKRFAERVRAEQAHRAGRSGGAGAGASQQAGGRGGGHRDAAPGSSDRETLVQEAYAVLGLQPGAGREDVLAAHKRLIRRVHPDTGGSDYLAAKINAARDLLLRHVAAKGPGS